MMKISVLYLLTVIIGLPILVGCTLTYEPDTKACMLHFSPSGEQIEAIGKACMGLISKVHEAPASVEVIEDEEGI